MAIDAIGVVVCFLVDVLVCAVVIVVFVPAVVVIISEVLDVVVRVAVDFAELAVDGVIPGKVDIFLAVSKLRLGEL